MIASLKSELRKIWTVRSTYVVLLFSIAIISFFAFYIEGFKAGDGSRAATDPGKLVGLIRDAISTLAVFGGLVGILSMTHEYRYNTISYTLTSAKSRSISFISKVLAISIFAIFFTALVTALAVGAMYIGLALKGLTLSPQVFDVTVVLKALFYGWAMSMYGLLLAAVIRQQVGTIVAYFLIQMLGEGIIGIFLKDNQAYLPFRALSQVLQPVVQEKGEEVHRIILSQNGAVLLVCGYIVVGWIIAWALYLRRDAN